MLESGTLILVPEVANGRGVGRAESWSQSILDGESEYRLGRVRPRRGPVWWRRNRGEAFDVVEGPDDAALCSVQSYPGRTSLGEVRDADGILIGRFGRIQLWDAFGRTWGWMSEDASSGCLRFADQDGKSFGECVKADVGWLLTFAPRLADHPLERMVILAAAVVKGPGREPSL